MTENNLNTGTETAPSELTTRPVSVGDDVNALLCDSREVNGVVVSRLDHMVTVRSEGGEENSTAVSMCRHR